MISDTGCDAGSCESYHALPNRVDQISASASIKHNKNI